MASRQTFEVTRTFNRWVFTIPQLSAARQQHLLGLSHLFNMDISGKPESVNTNFIGLYFFNFSHPIPVISELIGLEPTKSWVKGQGDAGVKGSENTRSFDLWCYELEVQSNEFIGKAVDGFVKDVLLPRSDIIKALTQNCEGEFKIVQYYRDGSNPGYHFSIDTLQILAACRLALDIDTYCLTM